MRAEAAGQSEKLTRNTAGGNDARNGDWTIETLPFTAKEARTKLEFDSLDPKVKPLNRAHCGPVVAAVAVTQT
jgi:hypothetical protein